MTPRTHYEPFEPMARIVPVGKHGLAEVEHFEVTEQDALWSSIRGRGEEVRAGKYAQLRIDNRLWMSDTQYEQFSNMEAVRAARGNVLIGGLGLGLIILPMLRKAEVQTVTVIERSADVIALVEPAVRASTEAAAKLTVIQADATAWKPARGSKYDLIYFDIWANICTDDVAQMQALHRRYRSYVAKGGKVTSWQYKRLQYLKRSGRWR